jgi:glutamate carboxypeptidase
MADILTHRIRDHLGRHREEMVRFLSDFAAIETPSTDPASQEEAFSFLTRALDEIDYQARRISGQTTGGHLFARPRGRTRGRPSQLMVGHCDTVWPRGTLTTMPLVREDGMLRGPGVFDMKGGLTMMVFALRTLREMGLDPPATPVAFVNSDEEIGSPESRRYIQLVSRNVARAFILEPAFGLTGKIKTARKGVGMFTVTVRGRAAHAGLEPESGASAILELAYLIQKLHEMNDRERGISVNVGVIDGGLRPNVVAPVSRAQVDVRVMNMEDGRRIEDAILGLRPHTPGVTLEVEGGIRSPPLERTPRNLVLWDAARQAGRELGLELEDVTAGGGSDGNTTSQFTATLDGLGPVGDGAHAPREFVFVESLVERCALLTRLLMWDL